MGRVAGRRPPVAAFGRGAPVSQGPRPFSRAEAAVAVAVVVAFVAAVAAFAAAGRPAGATRATSYGGSLVIDDTRGGPVVLDLADGTATLRLTGVAAQVGATSEADVAALALADGTLLLDRVTGTVNFVDPSQIVVDAAGAGVALPGPPGATTATAVADGASAFVVRQGPASSSVSLVDRATVAAAVHGAPAATGSRPAAVRRAAGPVEAVAVPTATEGPLAGGAGATAAADGDLWLLVRGAGGAVHVAEVGPGGRHGALTVTDRGALDATGRGALSVTDRGARGGAGSVLPAAGGTRAVGGTAATGRTPASGGTRAAGGAAASGTTARTVVAALASGSLAGARSPGGTVPGGPPGPVAGPPTGAVALATAGSIRLLVRPRGSRAPARTATGMAAGAVTGIVPVAGATGEVLFAVRATSGWYLVGVDLRTGARVGPVAVHGPAPTGLARRRAGGGGGTVGPVALVRPALDGGSVFALVAPVDGTAAAPGPAPAVTTRPTLVRIDAATGAAATVPPGPGGSGAYPLVGPDEQPVWAHEQVVAAGPRVVVNDPDAELAVVVRTGGGDRATTVDKGSAVDISASVPPDAQVVAAGGTGAGGGTGGDGGGTSGPAPSPQARAASQTVDAALACRTGQQKPNVPQVAPPQAAAHAVTLSWTYPLIDPEDCTPSSYTVTATGVGGTPSPVPSTVAVTGQTSLVFTGLRSSSTYDFVVTAYIGEQRTAAPPVAATTSAEGPPPAASVTARGNGSTGWVVRWAPCRVGCVSTEPVGTWQVTASACPGTYIGTPPTLRVPAAQDTVTLPFTAAPGLLGASLRFVVQPMGANGLLGDPTTTPACSEGWRQPRAADIRLDVAEPPPAGTTATATLTVVPAPGLASVDVFGSDATELVFAVGGVPQPPTTRPSAVFAGLRPGTSYATQVTVYPAGHPEAAVTVAGPRVAPTVPWPSGLRLSATTTVESFVSGLLRVTVADAFAGVPPGTPMGLAASGDVVCGNEETPVPPTAVGRGPGTDGTLAVPLDAASGELGGGCTLDLSLAEPATDVHGGPSPRLHLAFSVRGAGTLSASWDPSPVPPYTNLARVEVVASGDAGAVTGWTARVVAPSGCAATGQSAAADGSVLLDVTPCVAAAYGAMEEQGASQAVLQLTVQVAWAAGSLGVQSETLQLPAEILQRPGSGVSGSGGSGSGGSGSGGSSSGGSSSGGSGSGGSGSGGSGSGGSGSGGSGSGSGGSGPAPGGTGGSGS